MRHTTGWQLLVPASDRALLCSTPSPAADIVPTLLAAAVISAVPMMLEALASSLKPAS